MKKKHRYVIISQERNLSDGSETNSPLVLKLTKRITSDEAATECFEAARDNLENCEEDSEYVRVSEIYEDARHVWYDLLCYGKIVRYHFYATEVE